MAEYIEREAAIEAFMGEFPDAHYPSWYAEKLKELPTADVAEVRRGEWMWDVETHGDPMYCVDEDFGYRCSECKTWADEWGVDGDIYEEPPTRLHYCPNCGADMRGVEDGR